MKSVYLVIPDLFLPKDFAAEVCAGLPVPALEKLLGRGHSEIHEPVALEICCAKYLACHACQCHARQIALKSTPQSHRFQLLLTGSVRKA